MALAADCAAPAERGAAMGTYTTAFDLGIGLGASLWGTLIGLAGFQMMFGYSALMCLLGIVILAVGSNLAQRSVREKSVAEVK
jgi:predicted MFS family arabinose efflux permease